MRELIELVKASQTNQTHGNQWQAFNFGDWEI